MTGDEGLTNDEIRLLAQVADLDVAPESVPVLADLLREQVASLRAIPLRDLTEIDVELDFDPGWSTGS